MYEDIAYDAYDVLNNCDEQNVFAATKTCDQTEKRGILNTMSEFAIAAKGKFVRLKDNVCRSVADFYVPPIQALENERAFNNSIEWPFDHRKMNKKHDIKTLGDSLTYFRLSSQLQQLETSLEDVRRNKKNEKDHEECLKKIDKEIQLLSFKCHPDKVTNRGGTEEEIITAQKLQTALNATRTALKLLNSAFMEDISIDHKFEFYISLNIDSVCNEDEMQNRIFEVMLEMSIISRIKKQNIISEIRKFLTESKNCVRSYLDKTTEFKKHRNLALFHLRCCIEGFEKLCAELHNVKETCKSEKNNKNFLSVIEKMATDSKRNLRLLKSLNETAEASFKGRYRFFYPGEVMDSYFVLPLVWCMNVILMCNVMMRDASFFDVINKLNRDSGPRDNDDFKDLMDPYYLASYCSGSNYHEEKALEIIGKNDYLEEDERYGICRMRISKGEIELKFREHIREVSEVMERIFKVEDYAVTMTTDFLILDLKKCMAMMAEFEQKEQELSKGIEEFEKQTEKMHEQYEKIDKMMEAAEEMSQKVKERLEESRKCRESFKH